MELDAIDRQFSNYGKLTERDRYLADVEHYDNDDRHSCYGPREYGLRQLRDFCKVRQWTSPLEFCLRMAIKTEQIKRQCL